MAIIEGDPFEIKAQKDGGCIMLGYLDGVHLGHQALIEVVKTRAKELHTYSAAFTFNGKLFTKSIPIRGMLTTGQEKAKLLEYFGIDLVYLVEFTETLRDLSPEEFVVEVLHKRLKTASVAIGPNFNFGKGGKGGPKELLEIAKYHGIECIVIPQVKIDNEPISSSRIRNMLFSANIEEASKLLGRRYRLTGKVVKGKGFGTGLGYPTANLEIGNPLKLIPGEGVYTCFANLGGRFYMSAVPIGTRPTFMGTDRSIEAHILDFSGNLYGQEITLEFVTCLRLQKKFQNPADLAVQIGQDIERAREILGGLHE